MSQNADSLRLTPAQERILNDVRTTGERCYNGRARRQIEALESAGLVAVDWDADLVTKGGGSQMLWRIKVRPTCPRCKSPNWRRFGGPLGWWECKECRHYRHASHWPQQIDSSITEKKEQQ